MDTLTHEFAEWMQSWSTRLENAYNAGIDKDGWPRFEQAVAYFERNGKFTPGQIAYFVNRDKDLGQGKLKDYNTYRGLNKRMGNVLPVPVKAVVLGGLVDWSIQYQTLPDLIKRLERGMPGWEYNFKSGCWQGKSLAVMSHLEDIFN